MTVTDGAATGPGPRITIAIVDAGRRVPCAGDTLIVPWWSVTKTVLAATALCLVRDGALALDRPLPGQPYSLRHLLQHTAGFGDYGDLPDYHAAVARRDAPWSAAEMLLRCRADQLRDPPGTGWRYSNIGYLHVRALIERTTGLPVSRAMHRAVLAPLRLELTRLAEQPADLTGVTMGRTQGYHPGWVYHGLLVGPLHEAARMLDGVLGGALLPPALLAAMQSPRRVGPPIPGRPWAAPGYGLGLMIDCTGPDAPMGHTGGGPGTTITVLRRGHGSTARVRAAFACSDDSGPVEHTAVLG